MKKIPNFKRTLAVAVISAATLFFDADPSFAPPAPGPSEDSPSSAGSSSTSAGQRSLSTFCQKNPDAPACSSKDEETKNLVSGNTNTSYKTTSLGSENLKLNTNNIITLSNGLMWLALLACVIGICIAAALWAIGSKGQNPGQELTGKKGFIVCITAAFFIGALPTMLEWLDGLAHEADTTGVTGSRAAGSKTNPNTVSERQSISGPGIDE